MKRTSALGLLAVLLVLAGVAWAQTSPGYDLSWHVVATGGSDMASAGHVVRSTLGQFSIGPAGSESHTLGAGYWYGIRRAEAVEYRIYLPLVLRGDEGLVLRGF